MQIVTFAPLSYNNLDKSGIVPRSHQGYIWVTEEREIGSRGINSGPRFIAHDFSMRKFPGFPCFAYRESWDLEELEHQIERLVAARGIYGCASRLDVRALVSPAV